MPRLRPTTTAQRKGQAALDAHVRYDRLALSSPGGTVANRLREEGHDLVVQGQTEAAHERFVLAMDEFGPEDTDAAAAAAMYDLAESLKNRQGGSVQANLQEAKRLLERCLSSPARRADPVRLAMTYDALGQVQRRLALGALDPDTSLAHLGDAIRSIARACGLADEMGVLGWGPGANYYNSLGNALRQRGLVDDGITAHEKALTYVEARDSHPEFNVLGSRLAARGLYARNLADALLMRRNPGDAEEAVRLLRREASERGSEQPRVKLSLARALSITGHSDEARTVALSLPFDALDHEGLALAAEVLSEVGADHEALSVLASARHGAMRRRSEAISDVLADERLQAVQRLAAMEADIHVRRGDATAAFLVLENSSGLRFYDAVAFHARPPAGPVERLLRDRKDAVSACAAIAEDLGLRLTHVGSHAGDMLDAFAQTIDPDLEGADPFVAEPAAVLRVAIRNARVQASPATSMERAAEAFRQEALHLHRLLEQRVPSDGAAWSISMTRQRLNDLLEQHEDTVFVRAHLGKKLQAAAVWRGGSGLHTVDLGPEDLALLFAIAGEGAPDEMAFEALLRRLDLSPAFEGAAGSRLVILPSLLASLVPWAACGPAQRRLVERFDAISILPNLTPLESRQGPTPPRAGTLLVSPGSHPPNRGTRFHSLAFSEIGSNETVLAEERASVEAVLAATQQADVVSFFAHGFRGEGAGQIQLADGFISPATDPARSFRGCERIELWACDSGVNLPHDPLTAMVDEAFGLDIEFHRAGARSTIGTLWSVNDYATACIARAYRRHLRGGLPADEALAAAQRWWLTQAVPAFERAASENTLEDAIAFVTDHLATVLGAELCSEALGPASADQNPAAVTKIVRTLSSPRAWAGFRFVGVCERRPLNPWLDEYERPATVEQRAEAAALLKKGPAVGRTVDEWIHEWMKEVRAAVANGRPDPQQAIEMGRLFALRRVDKGCNNLIRGLAWVQEARTTADRAVAVRLSTEAAWLYLALARGEVVEERLRPLIGCSPHVLTRIRTAADVADEHESAVILAWAQHLAGDSPDLASAFSALGRMPPHSFERIRAAAELAALCLAYPNHPDALDRLKLERPSGGVGPEPRWLWIQRLEHALAMLTHAQGHDPAFPDWSALDHTRIARQLPAQMSPRGPDAHEATPVARHALNNGIGLLEGDMWGYPGDGPTDGWTTTGTPGLAWRSALAPYLAGKLAHPDDETASHFIASLHMGADLRIGPMNLFARGLGLGRTSGTPWSLAQHRERLVLGLLDSLDVPGPSVFEASASDLIARGEREQPIGMTGWAVGSLVTWGPTPAANTAAYQAEQQIHLVESTVRQSLDQLDREAGDTGRVLMEGLTPPNRLADVQDWVHALPTHSVLLGVMLGADGRLLMSSVYRDPDGPQERHYVGDVGGGFTVLATLAAMIHPLSDDDQHPARSRDVLLSELRTMLASPLQALLGHVPTSPPCPLTVLAPGPLRGLPWLALHAGAAPLWSLFSTVASLPHIGFERAAATGAWGGPVVSVAGAPAVASPNFGGCAIATVRHNHPPALAAEPQLPCGNTLPELGAIDSLADELGTLRIYGAPVAFGVNGSTERIGLVHNRVFTNQNRADTPLPKAELVELWCCVGRLGEAAGVRAMDGDVMPRMVHGMLASGALGVLDLAWPVHDLVKALVFEFHGHLRAQPNLAGGMELRQAVAYVDHILRQLEERRDQLKTVKRVLRALDRARALYLADWGGEVPPTGQFEVLHRQVSGSAQDLIAEITRPSHLAAFRYWGA